MAAFASTAVPCVLLLHLLRGHNKQELARIILIMIVCPRRLAKLGELKQQARLVSVIDGTPKHNDGSLRVIDCWIVEDRLHANTKFPQLGKFVGAKYC